MNVLVKKEIRLLLPSLSVAIVLALVQVITRPYDFYVACLLFFGLTIMALTTIGRETSLNTFSLLLSQPAERVRLWQTKLTVLAAGFLTVFVVWLAAFGIAYKNSHVDTSSDAASSYNLFITICLIATATFTGGLWTTLLLRQLAPAFWLTLLVPAVLSGVAGAFLSQTESDNTVIAVLSVVFAVYSVGGFLFARWLFFRAQDTGWSGGVVSLPEWKWFATRRENAVSIRVRRPIFALFKKEFQLHQASLMGAAGLLALHVGVILLRKYHHFAKDSAGEALTAVFWMLWLVLPVVIGAVAVAEERRLGILEGQLCQPVSRRVQFAIKGFLTLFLGTFLGGVLPMLLEHLATGLGADNPCFKLGASPGEIGVLLFSLSVVAFSAWLALVSFYASTLAKSFLQAIGFAIVTYISCTLIIPIFTHGRMLYLDSIPASSVLSLIIAIPTIIATLLWLAYLNFKNFRSGWAMLRRNVFGLAGVILFISVSSTAIYNRAWEVFEPVEPAHGPAKLSLSNPPVIHRGVYADNLLIQLPDGRVWFDLLDQYDANFDGNKLKAAWRLLINPLAKSAGPERFFAGSNWVSATTLYVDNLMGGKTPSGSNYNIHVTGYLDTAGIRSDGTLWVSEKPWSKDWTADRLTQFGDETNWQQITQPNSLSSMRLLKKDGTLWRWGTNHVDWQGWPQSWPGLRAFTPCQIGTNSDWKEIRRFLGQKRDGTVWFIPMTSGRDVRRATNFDQIPLQNLSIENDSLGACIHQDGTLWLYGELHGHGANLPQFETLQSGTETNWVSVSVAWNGMVALKSDGTLWEWDRKNHTFAVDFTAPPVRLGIHNDWVAMSGNGYGVVTLAADGSLWYWPYRQYLEYTQTLLRLPKQPQYLGNVFAGKAD